MSQSMELAFLIGNDFGALPGRVCKVMTLGIPFLSWPWCSSGRSPPERILYNKVEGVLGWSVGLRGPKITASSLLILGEKDYVIKIPGMEDLMRSGMAKRLMPNLEINVLAEGNHFVQEHLA